MKIERLQVELARVERRRTRLQQQIHAQASALYTSLPRKVGLKSVDDLILALVPYASSSVQNGLQNGSVPLSEASPATTAYLKKSARAKTSQQGDKRARYSDEQRNGVRQDLKEGKLTTKQISDKNKVRIESVKNWKNQWGFTKRRKPKKATKKA